ncbi:Hypothetical predicted protein [Cloeon dipterum]|uniref:39S ribosomal protein L28, mitochondrial n=1 Tax=Cloeon dipterum TaxID=197152 RepID=A0A8S1BUA2_9INSE|nr:Hypothetical predicted protein [Cloeon dipterum]
MNFYPHLYHSDRIVNIPIPLTWAPEMDNMLMGGEAIIKGFMQKKEKRRKVPKWWVPPLHKTVVYSEILNQYMPVIATKRLIELVHHHQGFDNYILQSPACDLRSLLAVKIKRKILISLAKKDLWPDNAEKRDELLTKYKEYIVPLEQAEWYGLTLKEAMVKNHLLKYVEPVPLKHQYRKELIEYLKERQENPQLDESSEDTSWLKQLKSKVTLSK